MFILFGIRTNDKLRTESFRLTECSDLDTAEQLMMENDRFKRFKVLDKEVGNCPLAQGRALAFGASGSGFKSRVGFCIGVTGDATDYAQ